MLSLIGMKREDVYITNTVKYCPPNNRDPLPEEFKECWPWLSKELNFIDPKIIITLGRHALQRFFPGESISKVHGEILNKKIKGMPTEHFLALYHPAAALYNSSMKETLISDFKKIKRILKEVGKKA